MKKPSPWRVTCAVAVLFACAWTAFPALAQPWPSKPIRLIVPYPPGGGNDTLARLFGIKLGERLGQPVVIENRPGAGTLIGSEAAAKAAGDGYTLLLSSVTTHALAPALYPKVPYDPIKDFVPITILAIAPTVVVVNKDFPATTLQELIAEAKRNPGKYTFASGGSGTTPHIAGEIFKSMAGIDLLHVPYKGGGPALTDLMGGRVDMMFDTAASAMPHVRGGKLRALAIASAKRHADYADLPTVTEAGLPSYRVDSWYSLHAPAGTPREVVVRIHSEIVEILKQPEVKEKLRALYADPSGLPPDEFATYIKAELDSYTKIIRAAGIKVE
ncbi:MAG: tripartite tricarboxylate transporter substrate binding protein [Lysobacterales bacterium]